MQILWKFFFAFRAQKDPKRADKFAHKAQNEGLLRNRAYVRHFANILALKALFGLYGLAHVYSKRVERLRSTLLLLLPTGKFVD